MWPTLYSNDRLWKIEVKESSDYSNIIRTHGKIDGKHVTSEKRITQGKNIGKKNETSVYEQACSEALSMWTKQNDAFNKSDFPIPMLAHTFKKIDENKASMTFPCLTQPKLDGVRLLVRLKPDGISMTSRTGKPMEDNPGLSKIKDQCFEILKNSPDILCLDGELYSHTSSFEDIISKSRSKTTNETVSDIQYHVYDAITEQPFKTRHAWLEWAIKESEVVKIVPVCVAQDIDALYDIHSQNIVKGFEGTMLRETEGKYEPKRSKTLQKLKDFHEEEFEIVGSKEGQGGDEGTVVFECVLPRDTKTFWVRPKGSREYRKTLFQNRSQFLGSKLTVIFQEYTQAGIPRFPVGKCIRDYE